MLESMLFGGSSYGYYDAPMDPEIADINLDTVEECTGNPFEFALQAVYENELNYLAVEKAIMLDEFAYLYETGRVIEESADRDNSLQKFCAAVINTLKKIWQKIVAFFRNIFNNLARQAKSDKDFYDKYKKDVEKIGDKEITLKKSIKAWPNTVAEAATRSSNLMEKLVKFANDNDASHVGADSATYYKNDKHAKVFDKIAPALNIDGFDKTKDISIKDLNEAIKKYIYGAKEKETISKASGLKSKLEEVGNAANLRKDVEDLYKISRDTINILIAEAKRLEKSAIQASKMDKDQKETERTNADKYYVVGRILNAAGSVLTTVSNNGVGAIISINKQNKELIKAAIKKNKADEDEDKKKNESFYYGGSGIELI